MSRNSLFACFLLWIVLFLSLPKAQGQINQQSITVLGEQKIRISGLVVDSQGVPIPGANVMEEGERHGVATDSEGRFIHQVSPEGKIRISFIGYVTQVVEVKNRQEFRITLEEDSYMLEDVVVTALGIKKKGSSLPYSTAQVGQDELVRVKDPHMIVALMGKIAGVDIYKSSSGMGGSVKVSLRGTRSVAGNNQPLYVLDGIPILNVSPEQPATAIGGNADAGNRDGGDGISNLNPEDVESISILKGASAAALYGTQAANGVILINTKSGRREKQEITFASSLSFEEAVSLPCWQNTYGVSDKIESWGEEKSFVARDNAGDFFRTGMLAVQSLTISSGNERFRNYFSYGNTTAKGIVPHHRLNKHNLNLKESAYFYEGRIRLEGNINLMQQWIKNRPVPGGFYMNPLVGLYRFPRENDLSEYRENYEVWDPERNLMVQHWHSSIEDFEQNPYWVINRIKSREEQTRVIASLSADVDITDWFKAKFRGSVDYLSNGSRQQYYATTAIALAGLNGRYTESTFKQTQYYGDVMMKFYKQSAGSFFNLVIGASINQNVTNRLRYDSKTASLKYPNVFTIANINMNTNAYIEEQQDATREIQSLYATLQYAWWKESFVVDLSVRNDWSSTLAFTRHESRGFFYPSLGFSWLVNRSLGMPEVVDLFKLRVAWSEVGNDIPLYITHPLAHILAGGSVQASDAAPFKEMQPEKVISWEAGFELALLKGRVSMDFTWYQSHTRNQFFKIPAQTGDDYAYRYVNAGNIRNRGIEYALKGTPIKRPLLKWDVTMNFSANRNRVLSLHEELPVFVYGPGGFSSSYAMRLVPGGEIGDIYGVAFKRDEEGRILYETEGAQKGLPLTEGAGNTIKVGNANSDCRWSVSNNIIWRGFSLYALVDARMGGDVLSQTQADMDMYGVSRETGQARDRGYVELEGQRITQVREFYKNNGGRSGTTEYYIYDATNIRIREFALGYDFPRRWLETTGFLKEVSLSVTARNLGFIYKKAPFDPDLILSTGNDNQAIDSYGMPTTRSWGAAVRITF